MKEILRVRYQRMFYSDGGRKIQDIIDYLINENEKNYIKFELCVQEFRFYGIDNSELQNILERGVIGLKLFMVFCRFFNKQIFS